MKAPDDQGVPNAARGEVVRADSGGPNSLIRRGLEHLARPGQELQVGLWRGHCRWTAEFLRGYVESFGFSFDGRVLATGGRDGTARTWDVATGLEIFRSKCHPTPVDSVALSGDGRWLATHCEWTPETRKLGVFQGIQVWDVATRQEFRRFSGWSESLSLSPDGKLLVSLSRDVVQCWDLTTGEQVFHVPNFGTMCTQFADDGRLVSAVIGEKGIEWAVLDLSAADPLFVPKQRFLPDKEEPVTVRVSHDAEYLATWRTNVVRVFELKTGRMLHHWDLDQLDFTCQDIGFAPGGHLVFVLNPDAHGAVQVWDARTERTLMSLVGHMREVRDISIAPNGLSAAVTDLWVHHIDLATGSQEEMPRVIPAARVFANVWSVVLVDDEVVTSAGINDHTMVVRNWDRSTGRCEITELRGLARYDASGLYFARNGQLVAAILGEAGVDSHVGVWHTTSGQQVCAWEPHVAWFTHLSFSMNGRLLAGAQYSYLGHRGGIRLWDTTTREEMRFWDIEAGAECVTLSPDGTRLACGSGDGIARLFDVGSGMLVGTCEGRPTTITSVAFSPDLRVLATGDAMGMVSVWKSPSGEPIQQWNKHGGRITSLAFTPDGKGLVSGSADGTVRFWE